MCETIHSIRDKNEERMLIKLDMHKAYDSVSWKFLGQVLSSFGFNEQWRKWIYLCIITTSFSIMFNVEPTSFFKSIRGLRQGDHISPYLFITMVEALGRKMEVARRRGIIKGIILAHSCNLISHHKFVDNTSLVGKTRIGEGIEIKKILDEYERASNKRFNYDKMNIYYFNTPYWR